MYVGEHGCALRRLWPVIGWRRKNRRHPVRCATRQSALDCLALKFVRRRRGGEACAIVQAVHIDHCANACCHFCDCGDEDAATTTDEEIARPGAESVAFNHRPVIRLEFEQSSGVRHHAWCVAAAERASAASDRIVLRPAYQPKSHMNVAAVASAHIVHVDESRDWLSKCQRLPTPHGLAACILPFGAMRMIAYRVGLSRARG